MLWLRQNFAVYVMASNIAWLINNSRKTDSNIFHKYENPTVRKNEHQIFVYETLYHYYGNPTVSKNEHQIFVHETLYHYYFIKMPKIIQHEITIYNVF